MNWGDTESMVWALTSVYEPEISNYSEGPSSVCPEGALENFGYLVLTCFFISKSIFKVNVGVA